MGRNKRIYAGFYLLCGIFARSYVPNSDNKYVQARCIAQNFTTDVNQWQGVDDESIEGSENLVKSDGVFMETHTKEYFEVKNSLSEDVAELNTFLIYDNGTTASSNGYRLSQYYRCVAGSQINYTNLFGVNTVAVISFYDKNKTYLKNLSIVGTSSKQTGTLTIPNDAVYVRICSNMTYNPAISFQSFEYKSITESINHFNQILGTIDNVPTYDSDNLVKSKGIFESVNFREERENANLVTEQEITVNNKFINYNDGVETPSNDYHISDYYVCIVGNTIEYSLFGISNVAIIAFYDKDKNYLKDYSVAGTTGITSGTVTVPNDAVYVRWCSNMTSVITHKVKTTYIKYTPVNQLVKSNSKLIYSAFGDSISSDETGTHSDGLAYPRQLASLLDMMLDRHTTPGTGVAQLKTYVTQSSEDAVLCTIMMGINNVGGLELGDIDEVMEETMEELAADTTFLGMYVYSMKTLRSRLVNPNALICCISPCTNFILDDPNSIHYSENLQNMRAGIKRFVEKMGGPNAGWFYINGRDILPLDRLYFINTSDTPDSTHPNSLGEAVMAKGIFNNLPDIQLYITRKQNVSSQSTSE